VRRGLCCRACSNCLYVSAWLAWLELKCTLNVRLDTRPAWLGSQCMACSCQSQNATQVQTPSLLKLSPILMLRCALEDCTVRLTAVLTCRRLQMVRVHSQVEPLQRCSTGPKTSHSCRKKAGKGMPEA
jgi:hypothetical protein